MKFDPRSFPQVPEMTAELAFANPSTLGESPLWDERRNVLFWVDIDEGKIHRFDPSSGTNTTMQFSTIVSSICKASSGGLAATMKKTFARIDPETAAIEILDTVEGDMPENRFNDGKVDRQGRYWAGTMNEVKIGTPDAGLYLYEGPGKLKKKISEVTISNGTGWSPDGTVMYYNDTLRYSVFAYDFDPDSGEISNRRVFAEFEPLAQGLPDGLTVDAEGHVWCAVVNYGRMLRLDPSGKLERAVTFPATRGTSCTFGGPDFDHLYITTARECLSSAEIASQPLSGSLFVCSPGVKGLSETAFIG